MSTMEKPVLIKPTLNEAQVVELVKRLYGLRVSSVQPMPGYDDQNFHVLVSESQETGDHSKSYVFKVMNSVDSQNADLIEAQTRAMMFLNEKGFPSPIPIPTTDGKIMSLESIDYGEESKTHMVRLLTYLPGTPLAQMPIGPQILYKAGRTLAQMNWVLTEFQHPTRESLQREDFLWKLSNTHMLDTYLHVMEEESHRQMVEQIIQQFKEKILPNLSKFRKSLNHGDFSHTNILVQPVKSSAEHSDPTHPQQELDISGILDFTDMSYGCSVCDVAVAIMYLMLESSDPLSVGGHVLSGFESVTPLGPEERDAVFLLVLCRFSQSLVLAKYNILLYPENEGYLLTTARSGWKYLHQLWSLGKEAVEKIWYEAAKTHCT
ncbi:hydroxylysine kinase-like isoform X2 [Scyliorhinus canicula]|nr:hydroxylysine kinase-like isoform X2 [Scyliorhinus canicula]XP_038640267.1 hydroxylysine kinase-like isoform X2 [Scyliorhinus canicula]XP_038640268.1 hydroxylysine kinase-like isoform X2 [Scyliorhinus canicula]